MWAMIASSIALIVWSAGLSFLAHKNIKRRVIEARDAETNEIVQNKVDDKEEI